MTKNADQRGEQPIRFKAALQRAGDQTILRLSEAASKNLPSRGQVAVYAKMDGHSFETVIEPDGEFGHWMRLDLKLRKAADAGPGDKVKVTIEPSEEWPEPDVPQDLRKALSNASKRRRGSLASEITPMARWEWVRWVNATRNVGHARATRRGEHVKAEQTESVDLAASTSPPAPTLSCQGAASSSWIEIQLHKLNS